MKKNYNLILILLLSLIFNSSMLININAQTFTGNKTLSSQSDVNTFGANNYTQITGYLIISGADITDLSSLSTLVEIGNALYVKENTNLTSLNGLNNITTVDNYLSISKNYALTNIDALSNITTLGGYLYINDNGVLDNIDALSNLPATINGGLYIQRNDLLSNINALINITTVTGDMVILENNDLTNINGLSNITSVGQQLWIKTNPNLTNLDGLNSITTVGQDLYITNNTALSSFCGLYTLLNGSGLNGSYNVSGNASNPSEADIIAGGGCALPVQLRTFSVNISNEKVHLNWETATEINNYGFEIQRQIQDLSNQNQSWKNISFVEGHGNSNSPNYYEFIDYEANYGKFFYRLKQIDIDGTEEYSDVVEIDLGLPSKFSLEQNYPNPFNPTTVIQYQIPSSKTLRTVSVQLNVYDVIGNKVVTLVNRQHQPGTYKISFDASELSNGVYIYKLIAGDFVNVKKMMLLK